MSRPGWTGSWTGSWTGTLLLTRHALRRDRLLVGLWISVLAGASYASAAATGSLYPTAADQVAAATAINTSPAIVALYGPVTDVRSLGDLAMTKMTVLYAVFVALLFLTLVRRHTRVEEEAGQTELIGGTAVGRDAPLGSAVIGSALVAVVLALVTAVVNVAGGLPVAGSLAFGASWAGIGLTTIGMTAVACQFSASARTCASLAAGFLGLAYALRAIGDTSAVWVSWLSPFGWSTQLRAYSGTRWWVLLLYVGLGGALVAVAQALRRHRDLGSGLVAARPGPASGSPRLGSALGLAARTHASTLLVWTVGCSAFGAVLGAIAPNIGHLLNSPGARQMIERLGGQGVLERTLLAAELSISAVVVSCFGISVIAHAGSDERSGRTEAVLATGVSRSRLFGAAALISWAGCAWLLLATGFALSLGYGIVGGDVGQAVADLTGAALAQAPAVWIVLALATAAFSWRSSWTPVGWGVLVAFLTLGQIGELVGLPGWVLGFSPFNHVPRMPVESFAAGTEAALCAVGSAVLGLAWLLHRRRDVG